MNFKEFWSLLQIELKQDITLKTLKRKKEFKAHFERNRKGDLFVQVRPKFGQPRGQIPFNEFEGIWDNAKVCSHKDRFLKKTKLLESYIKQTGEIGRTVHVPYIVALVSHIVKDQDMQ